MRRLVLICALSAGVAAAAQELDDPGAPVRALVERALSVRGLEAPAETVFEHLHGVPVARAAAHRLSRIERAVTDPWSVPGLGVELRALLAAPVEEERDLDPLVPGIAGLLDLATFPELASDPGIEELAVQWDELADEALTGEPLLEALSAYLATAHLVLAEANDGLDGEARELLFGRATEFAEVWYRSHFPESQPEEQLTPEQGAFLERWADALLVRARSTAPGRWRSRTRSCA